MKYTLDAKNQSIGRIATEIAEILQGKRSPSFDPARVGDDSVEVVNVDKMYITGNKRETKEYKWHTGYVGHLRTRTLGEAMDRDPSWVLRRAVYNMLPKNRLRKPRLKKLVIK